MNNALIFVNCSPYICNSLNDIFALSSNRGSMFRTIDRYQVSVLKGQGLEFDPLVSQAKIRKG